MKDTWDCNECHVENTLDTDPEEGQVLVCEECGVEHQVVAVDPLEIETVELPESDDVVDAEVEADVDGDEEWE